MLVKRITTWLGGRGYAPGEIVDMPDALALDHIRDSSAVAATESDLEQATAPAPIADEPAPELDPMLADADPDAPPDDAPAPVVETAEPTARRKRR